jgi:hypothetical protein
MSSYSASALIEPDPETSASRFRGLGYELAILLAMPGVILFALRTSPFFRGNNGDPFIYVGYARDLPGHIQRYGYSYWSVRFGIIFPMRLFLHVFGDLGGYIVLRYVLYLLAIVPMYFALRPFGRWNAFVGPIFFVANPVTSEAILSSYPDTFVVPYLVACVALLVIAFRQSGWRFYSIIFACGALAGMSINSNLSSVALFGISFAVFLVFLALGDRQRLFVRLVVSAGLMVFGILLVSGLGALYYRVRFGDGDIFSTTFAASRTLALSKFYRSPSYGWMTNRRFIYAPILILVATGLLYRRLGTSTAYRKAMAFLWLCCAGAVAFFWVQQFIFNGYTLEEAFYYSYVIGPTSLLVGCLWSVSRANDESRPALSACIFVLLLAYVSQLLEIRSFLIFLVICVAALAILRSVPNSIALGVGVVAMYLCWGATPRTIPPIRGAPFQYEPHYETVFGDADPTALDAYLLASRLADFVPSKVDNQPPVIFWYKSDAMLDSVQASYLWELTTIQQNPAPGMPALDDADLTRLRAFEGGYLVMLGHSEQEIADGRSSLQSKGVSAEPTGAVSMMKEGSSAVAVEVLHVIDVP